MFPGRRMTPKVLLPSHRLCGVCAVHPFSHLPPSLTLLWPHRSPWLAPKAAPPLTSLEQMPFHLPGRLFHFILIYFLPSCQYLLKTWFICFLAYCLFALLDCKSHEDKNLVCVIHCCAPGTRHVSQKAERLAPPRFTTRMQAGYQMGRVGMRREHRQGCTGKMSDLLKPLPKSTDVKEERPRPFAVAIITL